MTMFFHPRGATWFYFFLYIAIFRYDISLL